MFRSIPPIATAIVLAAASALGTPALAQSSVALRSAPTDTYRAVVVRPTADGLDVVVVDTNGAERPVRHLTPESLGLEPGSVLERGGSVSDRGWQVVYAVKPPGSTRTRYGVTVLLDLADPSRSPMIIPNDGFSGVRWVPDGQFAMHMLGPQSPGTVLVIDPEQGPSSAVLVPNVAMYGGGPEIVWAADGSGFLTGDRAPLGVTPIDGGPFIPGAPKDLSRVYGNGRVAGSGQAGVGTMNALDGPTTQWYHDELAPATPVHSQFAADGEAVWLLLDETVGPTPRAVLAKLTGAGQIASVQTIAFPEGPVAGLRLSSDDTYAAIYLGSEYTRFVLVPVAADEPPATAGPAIDGFLVGLVPAAAADAWPVGGPFASPIQVP
ncbi:MAG: hypothetical protein LH650_04805 [Chloroflexi bacterium]|nr:hypothetical protein [Chloroflexota bacterium]